MEFYKCNHCGNIVAYVNNSGVKVMCCGEAMQKITANTVEASAEKHIPVVKKEGNKIVITVGSVAHPMEENHHIEWIALETKAGNQRKILHYDQAPIAEFYIGPDDEVVRVYAYCNLHGLWAMQ